VGAEAAYHVTDGKISRFAAAVGYNAPEYAVTIHGLNNLNTFSASYYHKVNPDVEAGAKAIYDTKTTHHGVALEVGAKACVSDVRQYYSFADLFHSYLDSAAFLKAKINNHGVLALGSCRRVLCFKFILTLHL
jgi:voltage-dependent anion channel protein 2